MVVNIYASRVSPRARDRAARELAAAHDLETAATGSPGDATRICRDAREDGFDAVVVLGGDGTVSEAANGLAGGVTPLTCLPGGGTNVFCRSLGIPGDLATAVRRLAAAGDGLRPLRVDTGLMGDRRFLFASGVGFTARLARRADRRPLLKGRMGPGYLPYAAVSVLARDRDEPLPELRVEAGGRTLRCVSLVVQNADPLSYLGRRPIRVCESAGATSGTLSVAVARRARVRDLPTIAPAILSGDPARVLGHDQVDGVAAIGALRVDSLGGEPFDVELDGTHAGRHVAVEYRVEPGALRVLA